MFSNKLSKGISIFLTHDEIIRYLAMVSNHKDLYNKSFYSEIEIMRYINFINKKYLKKSPLA